MGNPDDIEEQQGEERVGADIERKARRLVELRDQRDADKRAAEKSERAYREYEQEFWQAIEESPFDGTVPLDLGPEIGTVKFSQRETYYGRLLDADKAQDYFESRAMADEMFEPKVAKRRLNEFVRECLDNGTPLPDGVDFFAQRGVTITRQKN